MSRSYRHNPVFNRWYINSEKDEKKRYHRKMRAVIRQRLHNFDEDEVLLPRPEKFPVCGIGAKMENGDSIPKSILN